MIKKLREPVNAVTHFGGAAAAAAGLLALLLLSEKSLPWLAALGIYGVSLVFMFAASSLYHAVKAGPRLNTFLRKVDHAAIYGLIAGTYTPFCALAFTGFWQWGMLTVIWGLAAIGIVVKLFVINAPRWVTAGVYVGMGWLSVFGVQEMLAALSPATTAWIAAGGVIYTLGAVVYITRRFDLKPGRFGFHEVWHIFVLLGAAAHFIAVMNLVLNRSA